MESAWHELVLFSMTVSMLLSGPTAIDSRRRAGAQVELQDARSSLAQLDPYEAQIVAQLGLTTSLFVHVFLTRGRQDLSTEIRWRDCCHFSLRPAAMGVTAFLVEPIEW